MKKDSSTRLECPQTFGLDKGKSENDIDNKKFQSNNLSEKEKEYSIGDMCKDDSHSIESKNKNLFHEQKSRDQQYNSSDDSRQGLLSTSGDQKAIFHALEDTFDNQYFEEIVTSINGESDHKQHLLKYKKLPFMRCTLDSVGVKFKNEIDVKVFQKEDYSMKFPKHATTSLDKYSWREKSESVSDAICKANSNCN